MLSAEISSVSNTNLFTCASLDGTRQLTVYSNRVNTPADNLMVLPVPTPATVKFETVPKKLFSQCSDSFPNYRNVRGIESLGVPRTDSYLVVQDHGSYQVVLVPSLADLERVPPGFVAMSDGLKAYIRSTYAPSFGVLVCKLKRGATDYEPFAYSHAIASDAETGARELFLPTRHYHVKSGGRSHSSNPLDFRHLQIVDDWDHNIYVVNPDKGRIGEREQFNSTCTVKRSTESNMINWAEFPVEFRHNDKTPLGWFKYYGLGANKDYTFPFLGVSADASVGETAAAGAAAPATATVAGGSGLFGWLPRLW